MENKLSRRKLLGLAFLGVGVAGGIGALELVNQNVLPGKQLLNQVDGACDVNEASYSIKELGQLELGSFYSKYRHQKVGYEIGYPPGYKPGDKLPLIIMLHGFGGNHTNALDSLKPNQAVSMTFNSKSFVPMALVTVDGGNGYWNPHSNDDPMSMVVDELIPLCKAKGLGTLDGSIALMGISMGGFGALMFCEQFPHIFKAAAAISPAIWYTYDEAQSANSGAFTNKTSFDKYNVVSGVNSLSMSTIRICDGVSDPFYPNASRFSKLLPKDSEIEFNSGCHTGPYFQSQQPPSLEFLSNYFHRNL